ncbi:MAG: prepilin-type N-terminal cleavage/methylation domain-containing protein [Candidatus Sumerlaeota bacterium]|nr:prepilin-type N-terminal cleavage/methylation domain-containing protein [Candidatus Sumerlaeota bacterium]
MRSRVQPSRFRAAGFTLLEVLSAMAIFAVILAALYSTFHTVMRVREQTYQRIEADAPNRYIEEVIRRDLACAVIPNGILAGSFLGTTQSQGDSRSDELEFYTASATLLEDENLPYGDIQKIDYSLQEPDVQTTSQGWDLIRSVTRNLLPLTEDEPEEQCLAHGVRSLGFQYYASQAWNDSWDSTAQDNAAPEAVLARVDFQPRSSDGQTPEPLEFIVPIDVRSSSSASSSGTGGSTTGGAQ